ncbi:unnamed protein product, partial [Amoebophrya sp. A120]
RSSFWWVDVGGLFQYGANVQLQSVSIRRFFSEHTNKYRRWHDNNCRLDFRNTGAGTSSGSWTPAPDPAAAFSSRPDARQNVEITTHAAGSRTSVEKYHDDCGFPSKHVHRTGPQCRGLRVSANCSAKCGDGWCNCWRGFIRGGNIVF